MNIRLIGGPFHGHMHELEANRPVPNAVGMKRDGELHWYGVRLHDLTARYTHSTKPELHEESAKDERRAMQRELGWWACCGCGRTLPPNLFGNETGVCKLCLKK